jgi:hypothetical protein
LHLTACPEGRWGSQCEQVCQCSNNARCNPADGRCSCLPGTWGPGCSNVCTCQNGSCDSITGVCTCTPGFVGKNCDKSCPGNTFGPQCASQCTCQNNQTETCRNTDGFCICRPGFNGLKCENPCPFGTFGRYCEEQCRCSSSAYICDPIAGCVCRKSSGDNQECVEVILSQSFRSDVENALHQRNQAQYSPWIAFLLIVTTACCFLLYRYKRRVSKLKNELYKAMYMRSGGPANDQFDNPLYAGNESLNIQKVPTTQIVFSQALPPAYSEFYKAPNEPTKRPPVNLFENPTQAAMGDETASGWNATNSKSVGGGVEPSASRANPNVYTSIDELKGVFNGKDLEPVYDEIGQQSSSPSQNQLVGTQIGRAMTRFDSDDSIDVTISNISIDQSNQPITSAESTFPQSLQALHYDTPRPMETTPSDPFKHYETISTASTFKADDSKTWNK